MEISQRLHHEPVQRRRLVATFSLELLAFGLLCILEILLRATSLFPVRTSLFDPSENAINLTLNDGRETMNKFASNAEVSYAVVVALSFCLPTCLVIVMELIRWKMADDDDATAVRVATLCVICSMTSFGRRVIRFIGTFLVGILMTMVFVDVTKVMTGRLRPVFLEVCDLNTTQCLSGTNSTQCFNGNGTQCSVGINSTQCLNTTQCFDNRNSTLCFNGNGTQCSVGINSTQCLNTTQCFDNRNSTQCFNGNGTQCSVGINSTQCLNTTQCFDNRNSTLCFNGNGTQCSVGFNSTHCLNTTQCYCGPVASQCADDVSSNPLCGIAFCTQSDPSLLRWARLSFPSFHAAITSFAAVFMAIYAEAMLTRGLRCNMLGPFITSCGVMASLLCGLSRYALYYSHWADVAVGFSIGTVIAVYICVFVLNDFMEFNELTSQRLYRHLSCLHALNTAPRNVTGDASKLPWYWTAWNWNLMENMQRDDMLMESTPNDDVISSESRSKRGVSRDQPEDSNPYTYY